MTASRAARAAHAQLSATAPSLAGFNGQLHCAFVADNGTGTVLACSSSGGVNWTGNTNVGVTWDARDRMISGSGGR